MCSKLVIGLFVAQLLVEAKGYSNNPTICLEQGVCYIGSWISETQNSSRRYASFQGIRYAQPPTLELRFKSPEPYIEEEGVYDVSMESNVICPQLANGVPIGQEDCLFLNIYVPEKVLNHAEKSFNAHVPVMFWIHGGSLLTGSNSFQFYGPKSLMSKEEVIFVTINYRLGPLGFLTMGTDFVPGNAGLRDQNMALNWIHENIVNFRGDPGSVTIFGGSAGSFSVAMHILSPMSKGLFHKAILQSGTALAPSWGPINIERALNNAMLLAEQLGCESFSLTCLQNQSMNDIINQTFILGMGRHNIAPFWSAVPDLNIVTDENNPPFLPGDAGKLLETGQFNTDIDIIIGSNQDEGIFRFFSQLENPGLWVRFKR